VLKYIRVKICTPPSPQTWQTRLTNHHRCDRHDWQTITDRDRNGTIIWQSVVGSLIHNHHKPRWTVWYPLLPHQRPWQTPRTSSTVRDWHFSDCLKCTMIYVVSGICEVYRSIWIYKLYTVVRERTISSHI
jgi:hypothetical protein